MCHSAAVTATMH